MATGDVETQRVRVRLEYGHISLRPHQWVVDDGGRVGLQYLRADYDGDGREVSRKVLAPVAWITFGNVEND